MPNLNTNGEIVQVNNERQGRKCHTRKNILNSLQRICKLRDGSFSTNAVKLLDALPKKLRNTTGCSVDNFKKELDNFLASVPDEPQITGMTMYRRAASNSIVDMMGL